MEREILAKQLEQAERHVTFAERVLADQRLRVLGMALRGEDATATREIVSQLEQLLRLYIYDREELRRQLDQLATPRSTLANASASPLSSR
jgi:hypothetical protein